MWVSVDGGRLRANDPKKGWWAVGGLSGYRLVGDYAARWGLSTDFPPQCILPRRPGVPRDAEGVNVRVARDHIGVGGGGGVLGYFGGAAVTCYCQVQTGAAGAVPCRPSTRRPTGAGVVVDVAPVRRSEPLSVRRSVRQFGHGGAQLVPRSASRSARQSSSRSARSRVAASRHAGPRRRAVGGRGRRRGGPNDDRLGPKWKHYSGVGRGKGTGDRQDCHRYRHHHRRCRRRSRLTRHSYRQPLRWPGRPPVRRSRVGKSRPPDR